MHHNVAGQLGWVHYKKSTSSVQYIDCQIELQITGTNENLHMHNTISKLVWFVWFNLMRLAQVDDSN